MAGVLVIGNTKLMHAPPFPLANPGKFSFSVNADNNSYARQSGDHWWAPKGTFILGEIAWKIFRDLAVNRDILDQLSPNNSVILETLVLPCLDREQFSDGANGNSSVQSRMTLVIWFGRFRLLSAILLASIRACA